MNPNTIDLELRFLAAQSDAGNLADIQKLSPAQMAALATTLGRKHGIRIAFGDFDTASTDGAVISLPMMSRKNSWLVRGYLDHELGHVRLTDFSLIPDESLFRKSLWNALEDIRIEAAMPLFYPGMATNYRVLMRELKSSDPTFFMVEDHHMPDAKIVAYISAMLRALYLKQPEMADFALTAREVFIKAFGADLERRLFSAIIKIDQAKRPRDVLDLVEEIIGLLEHQLTSPPEDQDNEPEESDGKTDKADESGETADTPPDENQNEPDDAPPDQDQEAINDEAGPADDTGNEDNPASPGDLPLPESGDDAHPEQDADHLKPESGDEDNPEPVSDDAQPVGVTDHGNPEAPPDSSDQISPKNLIRQALDSSSVITDFGNQLRLLAQSREDEQGDRGMYEISRAATNDELRHAGYEPQPITVPSAILAGLSSRLRGLLQAHDLLHATPGMSGHRIARSRLHRIKTGDPRLFLKRTPQKMVHTAIHVLMDHSSSMCNFHRFVKGREVVLALVKALGPLRGVNLGVSLFPAYNQFYGMDHGCRGSVATVLPHNRKNGNTLLYSNTPDGGTPLGPSLRYVVSSMLGLTEPRKIILIITDGDPDSLYEADVSIQEAVSLGFQVVALGIEALACPEIFPHAEILKTLAELPEKTFRLLEKLLLYPQVN